MEFQTRLRQKYRQIFYLVSDIRGCFFLTSAKLPKALFIFLPPLRLRAVAEHTPNGFFYNNRNLKILYTPKLRGFYENFYFRSGFESLLKTNRIFFIQKLLKGITVPIVRFIY